MSAHDLTGRTRNRPASPEEMELATIRRLLTYLSVVTTLILAVIAGGLFYAAYYLMTVAYSIHQDIVK
jgi:hypothetical protein